MAEQTNLDRTQTSVTGQQAGLIESFNQLALSNGWEQNSKKYKAERTTYMHAEADTHIGSFDRGGAAGKLAGLQWLCEELGVSPIPGSITQCKKELKKVHVCIVDLIDYLRENDSRRGNGTAVHSYRDLEQRLPGTAVRVFHSPWDLRQHIKSSKHYFPKDKAKKDGLLKLLLRNIINGSKV